MALRTAFRPTRCIDGRTMRHDPQHDDPELETDIGQCEKCAGKGCDVSHCEKCGCELNDEAAHIESLDEIWCHSCADNAAESVWERHCEDFHDGGATRFNSLLDDQAAARRLK